MDFQFQASDSESDIVLKCAMKRANGTEAWGILRPADWRSVIRPDGDEVGVFLRQDSLDLPYEPSQKTSNQKSKVRHLRVLLSSFTNSSAYYHIDTSRCKNHSTMIRLLPPLEPNWREKSCT
jgi:hypothetical protein